MSEWLTPIQTSVNLIKRVERTHSNLGLPLIFLLCTDLSDYGLFIVGNRAKGKGSLLHALIELRRREVIKVSTLTYAGIAKLAERLNGKSVTVVNEDFSNFYTEYLRDVGVNLISTLIYDHNIHSHTGRYEIDIDDTTISFLSGTQPQSVRRINRLPSWESMYRDRFLRYYLFYPLGAPNYIKAPIEVGTLSYERTEPRKLMLPSQLKKLVSYQRVKSLIEAQTSEGRCEDITDMMLKSHAFINGRDTVVEADIRLMELFSLNLVVDKLLSTRKHGVANPMIFDANSYILLAYLIEHGGATKKQMSNDLTTSVATLTRNLAPLLASGIVKGQFGGINYHINEEFYLKYVYPIIQFYKEIGILRKEVGA